MSNFRGQAEVKMCHSLPLLLRHSQSCGVLFFLKMEETIPPLFALPHSIQSTNGPLYRFVIYG
jgi:hypothetical protein